MVFYTFTLVLSPPGITTLYLHSPLSHPVTRYPLQIRGPVCSFYVSHFRPSQSSLHLFMLSSVHLLMIRLEMLLRDNTIRAL